MDKIFEMVERYPGLEATADVDEQRFVLHLSEEISFHFDLDPAVKERLIHGLDDIGITLKNTSAIDAYESNHHAQMKW